MVWSGRHLIYLSHSEYVVAARMHSPKGLSICPPTIDSPKREGEGGGGQMKFDPDKTGGGAIISLAMLKEGGGGAQNVLR